MNEDICYFICNYLLQIDIFKFCHGNSMKVWYFWQKLEPNQINHLPPISPIKFSMLNSIQLITSSLLPVWLINSPDLLEIYYQKHSNYLNKNTPKDIIPLTNNKSQKLSMENYPFNTPRKPTLHLEIEEPYPD